MTKRNFVLEQLDHLGVRTYIPPPNCLILELVDKGQVKTRGGILVPEVWAEAPDDHGRQDTQERKKPLGHVLAVSDQVTGDFWPQVGPPCAAGDYVLFSGAMGLITEIEDEMYVMNFDCVSLVIREGDWSDRGVVHVTQPEEKPTTIHISSKGEA